MFWQPDEYAVISKPLTPECLKDAEDNSTVLSYKNTQILMNHMKHFLYYCFLAMLSVEPFISFKVRGALWAELYLDLYLCH